MITNHITVPTPAGVGEFDACLLGWAAGGEPMILDELSLPRDVQVAMLACADELTADSTAMLLGTSLVTGGPNSGCGTVEDLLLLTGDPLARALGEHVSRVVGAIAFRSVAGSLGVDLSPEQEVESVEQTEQLLAEIAATADVLERLAVG